MISRRISGQKGRLIHTDIELVELTEKARAKIRNSLALKTKATFDKLLKIGGIEPKPDKSIIETEMDG